ncbi:MAG TPA: SGNH/GDSL hydrolase family protein [Verrucomicrobiae bacterium]|nr:SGNH/GDSL hydrolase family protein [Verrucomicrobiae bacterium]
MNHWTTKAFLLVVALLCGCELIVRVCFARSMSGRFEYGYNPASGFREKTDGTVHLVRAGGRRFHPQSFARKRPDGVFRIMVIGDSVPRGPSLQRAYAHRVGELLRAQGAQAESFNLAVPGYGARRNQIVLRQALKYQPSLIILHLNGSNEFEDERDWQRAREFQSWHPRNWPMKSLLLRRLHEMKTERLFWRWLPQEIRSEGAANDAGDEIAAAHDPEKTRRWKDLVHKKTAEDVALARQAQVPLLLLTQARCERRPEGSAVLDDHGLDSMARSLAGETVSHLSMKEVLAGTDPEKLFADGSHLRDEGHDWLARAIVAKLRREGLIRSAQ